MLTRDDIKEVEITDSNDSPAYVVYYVSNGESGNKEFSNETTALEFANRIDGIKQTYATSWGEETSTVSATITHYFTPAPRTEILTQAEGNNMETETLTTHALGDMLGMLNDSEVLVFAIANNPVGNKVTGFIRAKNCTIDSTEYRLSLPEPKKGYDTYTSMWREISRSFNTYGQPVWIMARKAPGWIDVYRVTINPDQLAINGLQLKGDFNMWE